MPRPELDDLQREIIDFDSEAPEGQAFLAFTTATGLSRFTDIPWPKAQAPKTDAKARKGKAGALPRADALVVAWTVDEGHALSRVLTPGKDSRNDYVSYKHNFARIAKKMRKGCPALKAGRLGAYWTTRIGGKRVVVFKSDSHLSQDTKKAPKPGETLPNQKLFAKAKALFNANEAQLPKDNPRPPKITITRAVKASVLTTDFFGFDTSNDFYKLQGLGSVSEMGDAVLGLVRSRTNVKVPQWLAVRNVSDPQIKAEGTLKDQAKIAAQIYKGFGRWSSVCSAIVCWGLIAA